MKIKFLNEIYNLYEPPNVTLSANWIDTTFSYVAGYIVRSDGVVIESKVRDSRSE